MESDGYLLEACDAGCVVVVVNVLGDNLDCKLAPYAGEFVVIFVLAEEVEAT